MKLLRTIPAFAAALFIGLANAYAVGLFPGLPAATAVTNNECIPADTNLTQGLTPQTECFTPGQINQVADQNALGQYSNIPLGSVAYGSLGTDTTPVAGTTYWVSFTLPFDMTIKGMACLNGSAAATDKLIYALYSNAGAVVANTALAGTTASGTNAFQALDFTANYVAKGGKYFMAYQTNGTTTRFRTIAASTFIGRATTSATGTFGTLPTLTVPTTFTADKGPICYVYTP